MLIRIQDLIDIGGSVYVYTGDSTKGDVSRKELTPNQSIEIHFNTPIDGKTLAVMEKAADSLTGNSQLSVIAVEAFIRNCQGLALLGIAK